MVTTRLFPVTRIHEPLMIEVATEGGKVTDARCSGLMYRGFEEMLKGRDPRDAIFFTQRICGICSTAHGIAAAYALEEAWGLEPTPNGQLLRNLIFGADLVQNHLRHFYVLVLPDYVEGPPMAPFAPRVRGDLRLPSKENDRLVKNYWDALAVSAKAHQLLAIFGAKAPHQQTVYPTGVSVPVTADRVNTFRSVLEEIKAFVDHRYLPDVEVLGRYYPDYFEIGRGYGNLLSYGMFPDPAPRGKRFFPPGLVVDLGEIRPLHPEAITEEIEYSWYRDDEPRRPPAQGLTIPDPDKEGAYSWVKAPRYQGKPFEGGPLARLWLKGIYRRGVSVMDRLVARALETQMVCREMLAWLDALEPGQPSLVPYHPAEEGRGAGLTDAMRGALGHWIRIREGKLDHYQIVTPTAWNFAPRGLDGQRGPVEEALVGAPVADPENLLEVGRVIRSFDPCFTCAVHLMEAEGRIGNKFIL